MVGPDIQVGCVGCSWVEHCETSALAYHFRVLVDGVPWVVCGCGQARCWVVGEQAHTLVGVCGGSSSAAVDCHSLCWGWWSGCVVVVVDL